MLKLSKTHSLQLLCIGILTALTSSALAQSAASWPNKPVRVIVPYPPGGATDAVARMVSEKFTKELGQNFLIDNRSGGDGVIGMEMATKAAPDGYTLIVDTSGFLVNQWLRPNLPFNALKEITPISTLTRGDFLFVVHPSLPVSNLKDFISFAKAHPGKLNVWSGSSIGTLTNQMFMNATGTRLTIVNYKGPAQAMVDLLSGQIEVGLTNVASSAQYIKAGRLKGIAFAGTQRSPLLPAVQTFKEAGMGNFDPYNWIALLAPTKTSRDIIEKMNAQARKALETPEVVSALVKRDLEPYYTTVVQAEQFINKESDKFAKTIKATGMKAENN